jgi:methylated-DNA-[protein]-cysteine S-methyltransferase
MGKETHQYAVMDSPVGRIRLAVDDRGELCRLDFVSPSTGLHVAQSRHMKAVQKALLAYFDNPGCATDVSVSLQGTRFQKRVWRALQQIPPGQTRTYGDLARRLRTSPRAVGQACKANPVSVLVPCHRVVSAGGMGGYGGAVAGGRMKIKQWLLEHEQHAGD